MPINIAFNPAAGVVAGAALLGGQGDYQRFVQGALQDQWKTGLNASLQQQQIQNDRLQAMQQAAIQQQQIAAHSADQQSQQQFEANMLPMRSALDAQNYAFQSNLQEGVHQRQSAQDFGEASQLSQQQANQVAAQHAQQQQGDLYNKQAMASYSEDQRVAQQFQSDPFQTMKQNQQQAQQSGSSYSPDQQQRMQRAKQNLTAMQEQLQGGNATLPTLLPAIKQEMYTLRSISANPEVSPPTPLPQQISQKISYGWTDPKTGQIKPGTEDIPWYIDKNGEPSVPRGYPKPEAGGQVGEDGQIISSKVAGQNIVNQGLQAKNNMMRSEYVRKAVQAEMQMNPMLMGDHDAVVALRQQIESEFDAANPGMAKPVHQDPNVPQQPPAPGITPQNPQGQQAAPQGGQIPPQQQQPAPQQAHPQNGQQQAQQPPDLSKVPPIPVHEIQGVEHRLVNTPRDRWTPEDTFMWLRVLTTKSRMQQSPQVSPQSPQQAATGSPSRIRNFAEDPRFQAAMNGQ